MPDTFKNFIAGEWVAPSTGTYYENRNPAAWDEVIGCFPRSGPDDVAKAVASAKRLRLTDRKGGNADKGAAQDRDHPPANGAQENPQNSPGEQQQSDQNQSAPNSAPSPGMPDMSGLAALNGLASDDPDSKSSVARNTPPNSRKVPPGGEKGAGGPDHGSGTDPQHLYGQAENPPLGNDTFRIPVEVGPSEQGPSGAAPAAPPRRIKSTLNASQAPDQPFERAAIPASDRVTIKRVFQR